MDERQAVAALLALISADIEGDYDEIVLVTTMLEGVADCAISTFGASGERGREVPEAAWDILAALRHDMATPRGVLGSRPSLSGSLRVTSEPHSTTTHGRSGPWAWTPNRNAK